MSAQPFGPGQFMLTGKEQENEAKDAFVIKYGKAVDDIYKFLIQIENRDEYYLFARALNSAIVMATQERLEAADERTEGHA